MTIDTHRFDDARKMLETERLDVVQVCARGDRIPHLVRACLERGLPVMAEKPLAMDLPILEGLFQLARTKKLALIPMHTMRGEPALAAIKRAVRGGEIGEPLLSFSQKSYKWGNDRSDAYRSRKTFPGIAPWVGIHAFDWLHAILGDVFVSVQGCEGATARPDYPACASQAAFLLKMKNGGMATVTLDYLRRNPRGRTATSGCESLGLTALSRQRLLIGGRRLSPPTSLRARCRCAPNPTYSPSSPVPSAVKPRPRSRFLKPSALPKSPSRRSRPRIPDRLSRSASRSIATRDERGRESSRAVTMWLVQKPMVRCSGSGLSRNTVCDRILGDPSDRLFAQVLVEELADPLGNLRVAKTAVSGAGYGDKKAVHTCFLESAGETLRLVEWHGRVSRSVENQERRVITRDIGDWRRSPALCLCGPARRRR